MRRYTVYGGSFDPVHFGHLSLVERAVTLGYEVIMVPAFRHAFGKQSAPFRASCTHVCTGLPGRSARGPCQGVYH